MRVRSTTIVASVTRAYYNCTGSILEEQMSQVFANADASTAISNIQKKHHDRHAHCRLIRTHTLAV